MPKNKKRGAQKKGSGAGATGSHPPTDEENSIAGDNWSTASVLSDNSSYNECVSAEEQPEAEETVDQENFEDKMCDAIEGLLVKSGPQRAKNLEALKQGFCKKYCAEFLEKRKETVTDSLLRCLKKDSEKEQVLAAKCLGLLAIQIGGDICQVYSDIQSALVYRINDHKTSVPTRAQCASTMAICCFINNTLNDDDVQELSSKMSTLEDVFKMSYRNKASGALPQTSPLLSELSISCLDAWGLLLTRAPEYFVQDKAQSHISLLGDLLLSSDTELRIAAGEAIALLYDLNRYINEDFDESMEDTEMLCEQLKELSTEGTKHKARNALRQQRARFRDILQTVQDGIVGEECKKVGRTEIVIDDWAMKVQYNAFCNALHPGINVHLQENVMLRDFFELGAPVTAGSKPAQRMSKTQRKYYNSQADKARTVSRGKHRDKRSAVLGY